MKRLTTIICCVAMMILGCATAFQNFEFPSNKVAMAQPMPQPIVFDRPGLPLDVQFDLDKRLSHESPKVKDSINIIDSVRWETKVRWKTRYKDVADRTTARDVGEHLAPVTPDSMPNVPTITSTVDREEKTTDSVDVSKTSSIQLIVDDEVVYSSNDNHSGVGGQ